MKKALFLGVLAIYLVAAVTFGVMAQQADFSIDAKVGLLLDFDSGQILFSQNGNDQYIPASLVKVMTMYVALDHLAEGRISLEDQVVVSEAAWRMGGSQMFLEVGEEVSIEDLLFGISVVSGNDATVAMAEAVAGSQELFVRWMNEKAERLGLDLQFVDVHGLSEENQITAKDIALLAMNYITEHPEALAYHQERSFGYQPRSQNSPIVQSNRNGLLWRFEGTDGLKTGFLSKAGYNLLATAKQDGRRLIAVVLGSSSEQAREVEATALLNYGFRNFELVAISDLLPQNTERVYKGTERNVAFSPQAEYITIPRGEIDELTVKLTTEPVVAPIEQGQKIGEVQVGYQGEILTQTPLVASEEVERGSFLRVIIDSIILFFSNLIQRV